MMKNNQYLYWCFLAALLLIPALAAGAQGNGYSAVPSISADGRYVTFYSAATNFATGDTNGVLDVFVRDRTAGTTTLISKNASGEEGDGYSQNPFISGNGRYVAFESLATSLVAGDTNGAVDIFVRDRQTGTTSLVSRSSTGALANGNSNLATISADGRYVAFGSLADNLVTGDTNGWEDIFVRDRQTGTTTLISKYGAGVLGDDASSSPAISADGRYVAFSSMANNLVTEDTNGHTLDVFVRDRQTGTTTLVSKNSTGTQGNGESSMPSISDNGRYVAFYSSATNLVTGDTNDALDVFVRDRTTGTTTLVSKSTAGTYGNGDSWDPAISSDGRYVTFHSSADNLVMGDSNNEMDIFVRDRQTGTTTRVSKSSGGDEGNGVSMYPAISSDGRFLAFESLATNLVSPDANSYADIFVRDRTTGTTTLVSKS